LRGGLNWRWAPEPPTVPTGNNMIKKGPRWTLKKDYASPRGRDVKTLLFRNQKGGGGGWSVRKKVGGGTGGK